jgi:hypothetical protein
MKHGPYVTRLIMACIAREAVPRGGGMADAIQFFTDEKHRKAVLEHAETAAMNMLVAVKQARDNPYGEDNEAIAKAILDKIAAKRRNNL